MANYTIGDMVFETRVARGYSQEELSFGICSTSSLSRIENGAQVPGKRIFDALMQRLGVSESIYSAFISREEMELYRLKQKLVWKLENLDFGGIDELVNDMEERLNEWDSLEKQYLIFVKANIILHNGGDTAEVLQMFMDAIHITMPGFAKTDNIKSRLLTFDEITILNSIALLYTRMGERKHALKLLLELKEYMEEHKIDEEEKAKKYPMLLYNITIILGAEKRYREVMELCDIGIEACIKHNKLVPLPYLFNNKACAAAELHDLEVATEFFERSVMLFHICEKASLANGIMTEAKQRYNITLNQEPSIKGGRKNATS